MLLLVIIILGLGLLYFFTMWSQLPFLWELAVSFFPLGMPIILIGLFISLRNLWKKLYKRPTTPRPLEKYSIFFVLAFGGLFLLYSHTIQNFYQVTKSEEIQQDIETEGIKVLFANIYKENPNSDQLQEIISKYNPDLVLFVEFSDQHKDKLGSFIEANYPYINRTSWSKIFVGSVVFSKYPIENLAEDFEQGSWRYAYFAIEKGGEKYYFYEVHTSSPTSLENFQTRNQQLTRLAEDINSLHSATRTEDAKVLMLWDFNVTPRSPYYQKFAQSLATNWENKTRNLNLFFSWNLGEMLLIHQDFAKYLPTKMRFLAHPLKIFGAHIDHLFSNTQIKNLEIIQIPGSDHKGMVFEAY